MVGRAGGLRVGGEHAAPWRGAPVEAEGLLALPPHAAEDEDDEDEDDGRAHGEDDVEPEVLVGALRDAASLLRSPEKEEIEKCQFEMK